MVSPSQMHSCLPAELTDIVIDYLHDDRTTLRICTTVCQAWLPRARTKLYHKVALNIESLAPESRPFLFARTLHEQPSLGALVHVLDLHIPSAFQKYDVSDIVAAGVHAEHSDGNSIWYDVLGLGRLRNVHTLRLDPGPFYRFSHLFYVLCMFPALERLFISDFTIPTYETWDWEKEHGLPTIELLERGPRIRHLELEESDELLQPIEDGCRPGRMFSRLESLRLDDNTEDTRFGWLRLPATAIRETLQDFHFSLADRHYDNADSDGEEQPWPGSLLRKQCITLLRSLRACSELRFLSIVYYPFYSPLKRFDDAPFRAIAEEFGRADTRFAHFRELKFLLLGWTVDDVLPGLIAIGEDLAAALLHPARFPAFGRLSVCVQDQWQRRDCTTDASTRHVLQEKLQDAFRAFRDDLRAELAIEVV